jgi:hypothetical protein
MQQQQRVGQTRVAGDVLRASSGASLIAKLDLDIHLFSRGLLSIAARRRLRGVRCLVVSLLRYLSTLA